MNGDEQMSMCKSKNTIFALIAYDNKRKKFPPSS